jgi:hypothetical protein
MWVIIVAVIIASSAIFGYVEYTRYSSTTTSRAYVDKSIKDSKVVNNKVLTNLADQVNTNDRILFAGQKELEGKIVNTETRLSQEIKTQKDNIVQRPQLDTVIRDNNTNLNKVMDSKDNLIQQRFNNTISLQEKALSKSIKDTSTQFIATAAAYTDKKVGVIEGSVSKLSNTINEAAQKANVAHQNATNLQKSMNSLSTSLTNASKSGAKIVLPDAVDPAIINGIQSRMPDGKDILATSRDVTKVSNNVTALQSRVTSDIAALTNKVSNLQPNVAQSSAISGGNTYASVTDFTTLNTKHTTLSNTVSGLKNDVTTLQTQVNSLPKISSSSSSSSSYNSGDLAALREQVSAISKTIPVAGSFVTPTQLDGIKTSSANQLKDIQTHYVGSKATIGGGTTTVAPATMMAPMEKSGNKWISTAMGVNEYNNVVVAGNFGKIAGDVAVIGGHDKGFSKWTDLAINPAGDANVGIGLTKPTKKLDVAGGIRSASEICIGGTCISEADMKAIKASTTKSSSYVFNGKFAPPNWGYHIVGTGHENYREIYGNIPIVTPSAGYLIINWTGHTHIAHPDWAAYYTVLIDGENPLNTPAMQDVHTNPHIHMGAQHMYVQRQWYGLNVSIHAKVGSGRHILTPAVAIGSGQTVHINGAAVSWTFIPATENPINAIATLPRDVVLMLDASNRESYPGTGKKWFDLSVYKNDFTLPASGISWNSAGFFQLGNTTGAAGPPSDRFNISRDYTVLLVAQPQPGTCNSVLCFQGRDSTRMINIHLPWCDNTIYFDNKSCCGGQHRVQYGAKNPGMLKHYTFRCRTNQTPHREVFENAVSMVNSGTNLTSNTHEWGGQSTLFNYHQSGPHPWNGKFYMLQIFNRALNNEEITRHYNEMKSKFKF